MTFDAQIEMRFTDAWVALDSQDVLIGDYAIRWRRGIPGNRPTDNVASTGTLEFVLRNDAGNSAGLQGYYSPNHSHCRPGFTFGTRTRLVFVLDGVPMVMWTGRLRVIAPTPGADGIQTTVCLAHDVMGDLADIELREVGQQIEQSDSALIHALLDAVPADSQPTGRDIDAGLDTFPVAFDDLEGGTAALAVTERVATSAQAKVWVKGDGTLRYETRLTSALHAARFTFTDLILTELEVPSALDNVFNRVRITTHPKTFSPNAIVLASHLSSAPLAAGHTTEIWLTYQDPDRPEVHLGGSDFVPPEAGIDYSFNASADGSGTDVTSAITLTADFFSSSVKLTITNTGATPAYPQLVQVRGTGIYDIAPTTVEAFTSQPYGNRPITIDLPYQDDDTAAQARATYLQAAYRDLKRQVDALAFDATDSPDLMTLAAEGDIGDAVGVEETVTLPAAVTVYIQEIEGTITAGPVVIIRYRTAPRIIDDELHDDVVTTADAVVYNPHQPTSRIGNALIGLSEINPNGAPGAGILIQAFAGSVLVAGHDALLAKAVGRVIPAAGGALNITGVDAALAASTLALSAWFEFSGGFQEGGPEDTSVVASAGAVTITGGEVQFVTRRILAESGTVTTAGGNATLTKAPAGTRTPRVVGLLGITTHPLS